MRASALVQASSTPDPVPDTQEEEQATPGHLRRRWRVGRSGSMTRALFRRRGGIFSHPSPHPDGATVEV